MKVKIETITKNQTVRNLEVKQLETGRGMSKTSLTNRIQEKEKNIPDTKDLKEGIDSLA